MRKITPPQCRAARALLDWSQKHLAGAAAVGVSTIYDFERDRRWISEEAETAIRQALEKAGVEFTNGKRPGVRLRGS
jgi:transcriptional regulator with XRE-family HTH domain